MCLFQSSKPNSHATMIAIDNPVDGYNTFFRTWLIGKTKTNMGSRRINPKGMKKSIVGIVRFDCENRKDKNL